MFRRIASTLLLLLAASGATAQDVPTLLARADGYRLTAETLKVEMEVLLYRGETLDKERQYTVYVKPGRRSLVVFRHPAERGQKVLMLDDQFWLLIPTSRRPIRITPMQKLLGEASTGDIATMTWSDDYTGTVTGAVTERGIPCLRLELHAQRDGLSYQRIVLFLARQEHWPVAAQLYLGSGKLAKRVEFELGQEQGRPVIVSMTLMDRIQTERRTVIRYRSRTPTDIPERAFNPMYLVRETQADW